MQIYDVVVREDNSNNKLYFFRDVLWKKYIKNIYVRSKTYLNLHEVENKDGDCLNTPLLMVSWYQHSVLNSCY